MFVRCTDTKAGDHVLTEQSWSAWTSSAQIKRQHFSGFKVNMCKTESTMIKKKQFPAEFQSYLLILNELYWPSSWCQLWGPPAPVWFLQNKQIKTACYDIPGETKYNP